MVKPLSKAPARRILVIANPTAGIGTGRVNRERLLEVAQRDLERGGLQVEVALETARDAVVARAERACEEGFAAIVTMDSHGNSLHADVEKSTGENLRSLSHV